MARIQYIPNRVIDADGIADGASIYVYQTGTTTPVSLYSDEGLTTPVANPYVVASGAKVPVLYHGHAGDIRLYIVSDEGDIDDTDPYTPVVLGGIATSSGLTSNSGVVLGRQTSGVGDIEEITCSPVAVTLLDDVSALEMRGTLGLATVASSASAADLTTGELASARLSANQKYRSIEIIIDGGGVALTTGIKGYIEVPFSGTITSATALADQSGSVVVDVWKDTYANYPPTDADSITAAAPVTISTATKSQDTTLTGWTTAVTAGDILGFNVDSATTITRVTISLRITAS